jgi:hypothetical protein
MPSYAYKHGFVDYNAFSMERYMVFNATKTQRHESFATKAQRHKDFCHKDSKALSLKTI